MTGYCRHQLTVNIETLFNPKVQHFGNNNGAVFLVVYAENYGNNLDLKGTTPPYSGVLLTTVIHPTSYKPILSIF